MKYATHTAVLTSYASLLMICRCSLRELEDNERYLVQVQCSTIQSSSKESRGEQAMHRREEEGNRKLGKERGRKVERKAQSL